MIASNKTSVRSWERISRKVEVQVSMDNQDLRTMDSIEFDGLEDSDLHIRFIKTKTASRDKGRETVWQGTLEGTGGLGFATFVRSAGGQLSGTFSTEKAAHFLITFPDGSTHVKATPWSAFQDTVGGVVHEAPTTKSSASLNEIAAADLSAFVSFYPKEHGHFTPEIYRPETKLLVPPHRMLRGEGQDPITAAQNRLLQENFQVDVLVVVTNRAMCEFAGLEVGCPVTEANRAPMESAMSIAQVQTNEAMQGVGIPVETRIVQVIFLEDASFDAEPDTNTLDVLLYDQNVAQWRQDIGADLVAMITGPGTGQYQYVCGIAYLNTPVSATSSACLQGYTFTHELGHNFGANHDRNSVQESQLHPYGHGVQYISSTTAYRTVMAYQCPTVPGGCPVAPYFSNDEYGLTEAGLPLGDADHDNARLITENANYVSNLMDTVVIDAGGGDDSPSTSPPDDGPLSCPASPDQCPGENLLSLTLFFQCTEVCAAEGSVWFDVWVAIGYGCGGCP